MASLAEYDILEPLGAGGMGVVFKAVRNAPNAGMVAIKILKLELMNDLRARSAFFKEAAHQRNMSHPHILAILEARPDFAPPFLVMPYIGGGSLAARIGSKQPLPNEMTHRIAWSVALALKQAHDKGIIHQDLKPANILIDDSGQAFVADFGLARTIYNDSILNWQQHLQVGTASYMSPATAAGRIEDTRGDIYAFGAVLYEMLTGRPPYEARSAPEIIQAIIAGPPVPILKLNPNAPANLVAVAEKAMARELKNRYAQMGDALADLDTERHAAPVGQVISSGGFRSKIKRLRAPIAAVLFPVMALIALVVLIFIRNSGQSGAILANPAGVSAIKASLPVLPKATPTLTPIHRFRLPSVDLWARALVGDWDGNGKSALFVLNTNRLRVVTFDGRIVGETDVAPAGADYAQLEWMKEVDGDKQLFVSWRRESEACISVINHSFQETKRFSMKGVAGDSVLMPSLLEDLDKDGRLELVGVMNTGYGLKPRAVVCFNYATGEAKWSYPTASWLTSDIRAVDLQGDGNKVLISTSCAVDNSATEEDGSFDQCAYAMALNNKGQLLWGMEMGDDYVYAMPLSAPSDGNARAWVGAWTTAEGQNRKELEKKDIGELFRFDDNGTLIGHYDMGNTLQSCIVRDIDGDGIPEVLATDDQGWLYCLDSGLKLRNKALIQDNRYHSVRLRIIDAVDMNGDGELEIVLGGSQIEAPSIDNSSYQTSVDYRAHNHFVFIADRNLRKMAEYLVAEKVDNMTEIGVHVQDVNGDGKLEIVCLSDEVVLLEYKLKFPAPPIGK